MTTISNTVREDLARLENEPSAFPQDMLRETLEFIASEECIDEITRMQALTEITKRDSGIQILCIFPNPEDEDQTSFTYTTGADRVGCPEFLSFYPSFKTAGWVFNRLYQLMLDNKLELPTDPSKPVMVEDVLVDLQLALVLLTDKQRVEAYDKYTCQVTSVDVPIIQVVMPLPNGQWLSDFIPPGFLPSGSAGAQLFS